MYDELCRFSGAIPYEDPKGRETLWLTVMYPPEVLEELRPRLTSIYTELKLGRDADTIFEQAENRLHAVTWVSRS